MTNRKINSLITLLNDEDTAIAGVAMSELLACDSDSANVNRLIAELQESPDDSLRKKIHQIQAIQRIRQRRRKLSHRFSAKSTSLIQGLADLNMVWYDEYGAVELSGIWRNFAMNAVKQKLRSPRKLADFMLKSGFAIGTENIQDADLFCLGAVIEDRIGSDVLMAAIAMEIGRACGLYGVLIHTEKGFAVLISNTSYTDENSNFYGEIIIPSENWEVVSPESVLPFEIWSNNRVLKYITAMLFANSVCSEGPRYIQILGSCLAGRTEKENLSDILPYPFGDERSSCESSNKVI